MLLGKTFKVIETIGRGTTCIVYRCEDLDSHDEVAVKTPAPGIASPDELAQLLRRDFENSQLIHHHNVVRPDRLIAFEDTYLYSMELAELGPLAKQMAAESALMSIEQTINIVRQLFLGLQAIHDAGLTHRSIKPESVLVFRDGSVKLSDLHRATPHSKLLQPYAHGGAGPERPPVEMLHPVDLRSDLYAVGMLAYRLFTGHRPFDRGQSTQRCDTALRAPSDVRPGCDPKIDEVMIRVLHRDRRVRYQSAAEVLEDLEKCCST